MRNLIAFKIKILFIALLFSAGCDNKENYVGKYLLVKTGNEAVPVELELKADGQGSWSTDSDNVSFKWEVIGEKILLHTRTGGVISGEITDNTIHFKLPVIGEGFQSGIRLRKEKIAGR